MWRRSVNIALVCYVVGLLAVWSALDWAGDRWWMATVVLYAPRWLWGLPLCVLVPVAAVKHVRLLWLLVLVSAIVIGPIMGLCLPWRILLAPEKDGPRLRVLTCNSDYRDLDPTRFGALLNEVKPDIVAMQDVSTREMASVFNRDGWHVQINHGLYLASRYPIRAVETFDPDQFRPGLGGAACYDLETPAGIVHCFNLHLATPRWGLLAVIRGHSRGAEKLQANSDLRLRQSTTIRRRASTLPGPVLLAGDFNTLVESAIYHECWSGYTNAFSAAGLGWGNTHLTWHTGVRIDHILASPGWQVRRCWVGPDVGSAHRPVIADLSWNGKCSTAAPAALQSSKTPSSTRRRSTR